MSDRLIRILLASLCLLALACDPGDPASTTGDTDIDTADATEDAFLVAVRDTEPALEHENDSTLIRVGHDYCDQLDAGMSVEAILLGDTTLEPRARGVVIGGAVYLFCPEHTADVDSFVDRWG